jgi:hypothetical protein
MMTDQEKAKVLRKVLRIFGVDGRGWIKGSHGKPSKRSYKSFFGAQCIGARGCFCLDGGIIKVLGSSAFSSRLEMAEALGFPSLGMLQAWNDNKRRTIGQVRDRIFKAIRRLEAPSYGNPSL